MKLNIGWKTKIALFLIIVSVILYFANFIIFQDPKNLFFYISIDLAFIPIEVLLVVLLIEAAISEREKRVKLEKLNMVIGVFFSEVGTDLMDHLTSFQDNSNLDYLIITDKWSNEDYNQARTRLMDTNFQLKITKNQTSIEFLGELKHFLIQKRNFLLALLENPNLLEHESFTDLLQAVFHLTEELDRRQDITNQAEVDYLHISGDINRVYNLLVYEWLQYMEHLMENYPYLYSLAIRMNPFDPDASIEFKD